jgi:hypothetical protein
MKFPDPSSQQVAAFPAPLRELIAAELAAGNSIVAVEHGFPAAPCGASIKLAQAVSEVRRKSVDEVKFYARNNSSYAGEFTTAERHFFVLEPPLPPEPEPDMNAIRAAIEAKQRAADAELYREQAEQSDRSNSSTPGRDAPSSSALEKSTPRRALISTETATGWTRVLHFQDKRPPHEIQFALERELMTLFKPTMEDGILRWRAEATVVGALYEFELGFVAALPLQNAYSLGVATSWANQAAPTHDYYQKTSDSWFATWTRDLMPANPPDAAVGSPELYRKLTETALQAEASLDSVAAIQQAIIAGMKRGGSFGNSHKEGGTNITWRIDRFIRSDYGDYPDHKEFRTEAEFLPALLQFCQWEVARNTGAEKLTEYDTWKLILRRLQLG